MHQATILEIEAPNVARSYLGIRETTPNTGPEINRWLAHVNRLPGDPYCAAFVSVCVNEAAARVPIVPEFKKSSGALRLLEKNPTLVITATEAKDLLAAGTPLIGVLDMGKGKGHAFFAMGLAGDCVLTIEANTGAGPNVPAKDRDGDGVYERDDRLFDAVDGWMRIA